MTDELWQQKVVREKGLCGALFNDDTGGEVVCILPVGHPANEGNHSMTDPLEALEELVEKWRRLGAMPVGETAPNPMFTRHADELEPIIQQLLAERDELRRSRDAASALAASLRFSEREWRDKAQDKTAEVEALEAEREVLREHVKDHALHARSLSDALSLTGAEVESLRAERERYLTRIKELEDELSSRT